MRPENIEHFKLEMRHFMRWRNEPSKEGKAGILPVFRCSLMQQRDVAASRNDAYQV